MWRICASLVHTILAFPRFSLLRIAYQCALTEFSVSPLSFTHTSPCFQRRDKAWLSRKLPLPDSLLKPKFLDLGFFQNLCLCLLKMAVSFVSLKLRSSACLSPAGTECVSSHGVGVCLLSALATSMANPPSVAFPTRRIFSCLFHSFTTTSEWWAWM